MRMPQSDTAKQLSAAILITLAFFFFALPWSVKLDVPFTSQAPLGDWSEPWQDACEETSLFMVTSFYHRQTVTPTSAAKGIQETFATKNANIGTSHDESMETVSKLAKLVGMVSGRVVKNPSLYALKRELARSRPVITPVYAPLLGAGRYDGPIDYHVIVLVGYDDASGNFIVNDPGSANGQDNRIPYGILLSAIHDLNPTDYESGPKAVLFTNSNPPRTF